jgi:hypothetical protein
MHLFLADNLIPFNAGVKRQAGKGGAQKTQLQIFSFDFEKKKKSNLQNFSVVFKNGVKWKFDSESSLLYRLS